MDTLHDYATWAKLIRSMFNHKINVQGLYDAFQEPGIMIQQCPTEQQAADIFTKCLDVQKLQHTLDMIRIFDPKLPKE